MPFTFIQTLATLTRKIKLPWKLQACLENTAGIPAGTNGQSIKTCKTSIGVWKMFSDAPDHFKPDNGRRSVPPPVVFLSCGADGLCFKDCNFFPNKRDEVTAINPCIFQWLKSTDQEIVDAQFVIFHQSICDLFRRPNQPC